MLAGHALYDIPAAHEGEIRLEVEEEEEETETEARPLGAAKVIWPMLFIYQEHQDSDYLRQVALYPACLAHEALPPSPSRPLAGCRQPTSQSVPYADRIYHCTLDPGRPVTARLSAKQLIAWGVFKPMRNRTWPRPQAQGLYIAESFRCPAPSASV